MKIEAESANTIQSNKIKLTEQIETKSEEIQANHITAIQADYILADKHYPEILDFVLVPADSGSDGLDHLVRDDLNNEEQYNMENPLIDIDQASNLEQMLLDRILNDEIEIITEIEPQMKAKGIAETSKINTSEGIKNTEIASNVESEQLYNFEDIPNNSTFGTHKDQIMDLFTSIAEKIKMTSHALEVSHSQKFQYVEEYKSKAVASIIPSRCDSCSQPFRLKYITLEDQAGSLAVFNCGHAYHTSCLDIGFEASCVSCKVIGKRRKGKERLVEHSLPDLWLGNGDTARKGIERFKVLDKVLYGGNQAVEKLPKVKRKEKLKYSDNDLDIIIYNDD